MKVLVVGGSGRLGNEVMSVLRKASYDLRDLDLVSPRSGDYEYINGDVTSREEVDKTMKGVDSVVHLAWRWQPMFQRKGPGLTNSELWNSNLTGSFNVFDSAVKHNVKRVVYASSISALGLCTWVKSHSIEYFPIDESHPCKPQDLYGAGKLMIEELANMYARRSETSFIGLRFATIWFGHPDCDERTRMILDNYVKNFAKIDKQEKLFGPAVRDLCYQYVGVTDAASACKLALEKKGATSDVFNIGANDTPTDWDSTKLANFIYPNVPIRNLSTFRADRKKPLLNITRAQREIGYKPKFKWIEFL